MGDKVRVSRKLVKLVREGEEWVSTFETPTGPEVRERNGGENKSQHSSAYLLYYPVLGCLYFVLLYCTVLYCTVLYCTVLYCTVLCSAVKLV